MSEHYEQCVANYYANSTEWVEFTDDEYTWFLECVPPVSSRRDAYLSGEPYTHNREGEPVYLAMHQDEGKNLGRLMTLREFKQFLEPNAYEQRIERRKERLEYRADRARREAESHKQSADRMASVIPFGQPILVGHHSEGRDRRYRERIHGHMDKWCAGLDEAKELDYQASRVGTGGISSDDPDAIQKLTYQVEAGERLQRLVKELNQRFRNARLMTDQEDAPEKSHAIIDDHCISEQQTETLYRALWQHARMYQSSRPLKFPAYMLTNNNANIRRLKERIEELRKREAAPEREITGEGFRVEEDKLDNRILFHFDSKPPETVRTILKRQGFRWSPTREAWIRMLNTQGRYAAERVANELNQRASAQL